MHPFEQYLSQSRRHFLTTSASGLGGLALGSMLSNEGLLRAADPAGAGSGEAGTAPTNPLQSKPPHFAPKAKACIFIFLEGAPSQIDLFDPKPKLNELHGQPLPESLTKNVRFAFIKKETAVLMGSAAEVHEARPVRHGAVRPAAAPGHVRRRHLRWSARCTPTRSTTIPASSC